MHNKPGKPKRARGRPFEMADRRRLVVQVPADLLRRIDELVCDEGTSRSAVVREALERWLS